MSSRSRSCCVLIILAATIRRPTFVFSGDGWRDTLLTPSILLLLAIGQMVVIVTRNVDLSVGSILGVTAYVTGKIFIANPETPVVLVFLAGMLVGAALGAINGFLVAFFRVPALVVTLGTMYIFRGVLTNQIGSERIVAGDIPANFEKLGTEQILSIPVLTIIGLVVLAIVGYYLYTAAAAASSTPSARTPTPPGSTASTSASGCSARSCCAGRWPASPGVFYVARYATAFAGHRPDLELQAVAAVVIGGVAIFGGSGTVWGAALGAFLLVTINRALPILGISDFWQGAVVGALIIGSIVLDRVLTLRRTHQLIEARDES